MVESVQNNIKLGTVVKYVFQALDNDSYCLEAVIEQLDYALSFDQKNKTALWFLVGYIVSNFMIMKK
jgi:hypothetical protein